MAESSRDTQTNKADAEKKPETVLLTAEELRKIAGGQVSTPGGTTPPQSKDIIHPNPKP